MPETNIGLLPALVPSSVVWVLFAYQLEAMLPQWPAVRKKNVPALLRTLKPSEQRNWPP